MRAYKSIPSLSEQNSLLDKVAYKQAISDMLNGFTYTHHVTLATNSHYRAAPPTMDRMCAALSQFELRINRKIAGPRYQELPDRHIHGFVFVEKLSSNPHWHLIINVRPGQFRNLESFSGICWEKALGDVGGNALVQNISEYQEAHNLSNDNALKGYVIKSMLPDYAIENFHVLGTPELTH